MITKNTILIFFIKIKNTILIFFIKMMSKALQEPNLSNMIKGTKTIEGRLRTPFWNGIKIEDIVTFYDPQKPEIGYNFQVKNLYYAKNFGELYERFGHNLLPQIDSVREAIEYYSGLAGDTFSPENVAELGLNFEGYGVVGFEFILRNEQYE